MDFTVYKEPGGEGDSNHHAEASDGGTFGS
jgi:hypothetical protein